MSKMFSNKLHGNGLTLYFAAAALEALAGLAYLFAIPADPKNSILLGFSLPRLLLALALLAAGATGAALALRAWREPSWAERVKAWLSSFRVQRVAGVIAAVGVLLGWVGVWTPAYRLLQYGPYLERLRPLLVWALLVGLQTIGLLLAWRGGGWKGLKEELTAQGGAMVYSGLTLAVLLLVWLVVALTGVGLIPDKVHWNDTGVPLLAEQVSLALVLGAAMLLLKRRLRSRPGRSVDGLLFGLIWVVAAVL
jgi:hypothetical protein